MKHSHTATPWVYPTGSVTVRTKVGSIHLCNMSNGVPLKEQEANAEFIVRAVNAHDELVKAIKDLLYLFDIGNMEDEPDEPEQVRAKKVLAKAEKG